MLLLISPAKTLDFSSSQNTKRFSQPAYLTQAAQLVQRVRQYSAADLMTLMDISEPLATLNQQRFQQWQQPFTPANARAAILAFKGDVYEGLNADDFSDDDFEFAQQHLRILSGLYGLLRPLDLMQAYRLEMGRKIDTPQGKNLYEFWGEKITIGVNEMLAQQPQPALINLASNEYFKAIQPKHIQAPIITPEFKEYKNGEYKMLGVYAKRARGLLSRYVIKNRLQHPDDLKNFQQEGYCFNPPLSDAQHWVFTRQS